VTEASMTLTPANHASLTPSQISLLRKLSDFDAPFLRERLVIRDRKLSNEEFNELFTEFKKFVALCSISGKSLTVPSASVDDIWHQFILFTQLYERFCNEFLGFFLHHWPSSSFTVSPKNGIRDFLLSYAEVFGELSPVWGVEKMCQDPKELEAAGCSASPSCNGCHAPS